MPAVSSSDYRDTVEHKIRCLISNGNTASEIANRLGMNEQVVRRKLADMSITAPRATTRMPFGLSSNSYELRSMLGQILTDMFTSGMLQPDISEITGLNGRELAKARSHPYSHDWKLSQIERTLYQVNKTLKDSI